MGKTTRYQKPQVKKRCCATKALHSTLEPVEKIQLLHARVIKVNIKRELLAKIGRSADHFKGHICTTCINSIEACVTLEQEVHSSSQINEIGKDDVVQSGTFFFEGEIDFDDKIDRDNGTFSLDRDNGTFSQDDINCENEMQSEDDMNWDTSVIKNDSPETIQGIEGGTEPITGTVIILSLTNLRHDLDCLSPDVRALIAYELAAGEKARIRSDTLRLMNKRDISSLQDICSVDYLQERNKVLSNFVTGLSSASVDQKASSLLPSAQVLNRSDIYKIAKAIESCMGLTTPVAVLPFHFREIVLIYSHTRSREALTLLAHSGPHGGYQMIKNWLNKLGESGDGPKLAANKGDALAVFDNNQVLQRRWNICVDNRSVCSVITMVMFLDIEPEGTLQFQETFKPGNWMWENLDEEKLEQLKEGYLNPVHQDTWYIKHFHPWLTDIIQQVVNEQSLVDGKCVDDVDREVAAKKNDNAFRTCPACQYTRIQRRKKKCPSCNQLLPTIQQSVAGSNNKGKGQNCPTKGGATIRAFVKKKNETTYNISYKRSAQRASEYSHLSDHHPSNPPKVIIGEPISLNPCSYDAVAEVFRNIGRQAGIKKYGGTREWISIVCDGLPYVLGYQLIERTFVCELCNTSVQGLSERASHQEEHQKEDPGSQCNYTQEFDWVLLQPGPGHVEMNMLKTFVKFTWPVFWEGMVEIYNFRSEMAKKSARSVNDHHKGMALARIAWESFAKELVLPYVRQEMLKENGDLSVAGYLKFSMDSVDSSNYALIGELTFSILDAIFLYRAGLRCDDVAMIDAGRAMFARMWCARSHPLYRQLSTYDSIMTSCMPEPVREFNNKTKSINVNGQPHSNEGADFKLEALNRTVKHYVTTNPTEKDWKRACANQPKLEKMKQAAQEEMELKDPRERSTKSTVELGPQIKAFRTAIREKGFISDHNEDRPLTSFGNEPLDVDLVDFAETAAQREQQYLQNFIDHKRKGGFLKKSSVVFNEAPIFVTPEERSHYTNIQNKSVKQCTEIINKKIAEIEEEEMRNNFAAVFENEIVSKRGKKQDYLDFFAILEEYEMMASCDVGTEECVVNMEDCATDTVGHIVNTDDHAE